MVPVRQQDRTEESRYQHRKLLALHSSAPLHKRSLQDRVVRLDIIRWNICWASRSAAPTIAGVGGRRSGSGGSGGSGNGNGSSGVNICTSIGRTWPVAFNKFVSLGWY
jgi:hypothetical protein